MEQILIKVVTSVAKWCIMSATIGRVYPLGGKLPEERKPPGC